MSELGLLVCVLLSAAAGTGAGFLTGLVPGLHVNNVAAAVLAGAASALAFFSGMGDPFGVEEPGLMVSCFLVSALVSHCFSEAVPNTYVGIPSGDAVTVLPAHRLAKAGLGWAAVRASMDGSLAGVLLGTVALVPVSLLLGPPADLYGQVRPFIGYLILLLSCLLLLSDGLAAKASGLEAVSKAKRTATVAAVFLASGVLGVTVLDTNYFACSIPGCQSPFVPRSSLLLPLFAGLFGFPTLMLSLGSSGGKGPDVSLARKLRARGRSRDAALSLIGGVMVGWVPGLTSGSSATLCSSMARRPAEEAQEVEDAAGFIWLYSAISTAGALMSVGALFTIMRSRSGVMDAISEFLSPEPVGASVADLLAPAAILLSAVVSALSSYAAMEAARDRLRSLGSVLCSRRLAVAAMLFILSLVAVLTGLRGLLLLATACSLGVLPPVIGVRRIHLMGCLLVPITLMFI